MSDNDIVQRLRWCSIGGHGAPNVCDLAADEITSLRQRLAAAEAANSSLVKVLEADGHRHQICVTELSQVRKQLAAAETREQKDIAEIQRLNQKCIRLLQEIKRLEQSEDCWNDIW